MWPFKKSKKPKYTYDWYVKVTFNLTEKRAVYTSKYISTGDKFTDEAEKKALKYLKKVHNMLKRNKFIDIWGGIIRSKEVGYILHSIYKEVVEVPDDTKGKKVDKNG